MRLTKLSLACLVLGGSALLSACGGGDSFVGGSALTLRGTAATGVPVVGAVSATCKTGTGAATSNLDGSYTIVVGNGVGPCLLSITAGGVSLYSVTSGTGSTLTGNITPMTNALVNYLLSVPGISAVSPAAWFALPATQTLLVDTTALTLRIVRDFIPAMKTLLPSLTLTNADFLATTFTASPTSSSTDADLEQLKLKGIVTLTGAPSDATTKSLTTSASKSTPVVAATGASS